MSYESDMDRIIKNAVKQGWKYKQGENCHHQFYAPDGVSIVVASHSTANLGSYNNFLQDMKRAGYQHEMEEKPKLPNGGGSLSAREYIIDLLSRHPEGVSNADVAAYLLTVRPDLSKNTPYAVLGQLLAKGLAAKSLSGKYTLADGKHKAEIEEPSVSLSDEGIEADLRAIDEALAALMQIEKVVVNTRARLRKLAELKEMLK